MATGITKYEDLEDAVAAKVVTALPSSAKVKVIAAPMKGVAEPEMDQALVFLVPPFKATSEASIVATKVEQYLDVDFAIVVRKSDRSGVQDEGAARRGTNGTFDLVEALESAFVGWRPTLTGQGEAWPVFLLELGLYRVQGGYDIESLWRVRVKVVEP